MRGERQRTQSFTNVHCVCNSHAFSEVTGKRRHAGVEMEQSCCSRLSSGTRLASVRQMSVRGDAPIRTDGSDGTSNGDQ